MIKRILIIWLMILAVSVSAAFAANEPYLISFQGRLEGVTSPVNITFKLFTALAGGTQKWSETINNVSPDSSGMFSVLLGQTTVLGNVMFDNTSGLWMEITVTAGGITTTLSPRQALTAAPYAFVAKKVKAYTTGIIVDAKSSNYHAVRGETSANVASLAGVVGAHTNSSVFGYGVFGSALGTSAGVYGYNEGTGSGVTGNSTNGYGVRGTGLIAGGTFSSGGIGVSASSSKSGSGVKASSATGIGVEAISTSGVGAQATSRSNIGVKAITGVAGTATGLDVPALRAENLASSSNKQGRALEIKGRIYVDSSTVGVSIINDSNLGGSINTATINKPSGRIMIPIGSWKSYLKVNNANVANLSKIFVSVSMSQMSPEPHPRIIPTVVEQSAGKFLVKWSMYDQVVLTGGYLYLNFLVIDAL